MKEKIIRNIRKNNFFMFAIALVPAVMFDIMAVVIVYMFFVKGESMTEGWIVLIVAILGGVFFTRVLIQSLMIMINPERSECVNKYGGLDRMAEIIKEIMDDIEYEDKVLIISSKYIIEKGNFEKIMSFDNMMYATKIIHKVNYHTDGYRVEVVDKYGSSIQYVYKLKDEEAVDKILKRINNKLRR